MLFKIAVMDGNAKRCNHLCEWLQNNNYRAIAVQSFNDLQRCVVEHQFNAAIIDIESTGLHDRAVRTMGRIQPEMHFLLISQRNYHPELKNSLSQQVRACLMRPVDLNELLFWLESIDNPLVHQSGQA